MKTLDNTIRYHELIMSYDDTEHCPEFDLPEGFHFEFYQKKDKMDWIQIHIESGEFTSIREGESIFHSFYDSFIDELSKRCIFIVKNDSQEKVGTATISPLKQKEYGYEAAMDWVAIKRSYQGKHLSKPLISKGIHLAKELNYNKVILHTQTTSWLAVKIYLDIGFEPFKTTEDIGWQIVRTLTDNEKLQTYPKTNKENIYDVKNCKIEKQLEKIYNHEEFNYCVWDKRGLHHVSVFCNGVPYEYEVKENSEEIDLKLINEPQYRHLK